MVVVVVVVVVLGVVGGGNCYFLVSFMSGEKKDETQQQTSQKDLVIHQRNPTLSRFLNFEISLWLQKKRHGVRMRESCENW